MPVPGRTGVFGLYRDLKFMRLSAADDVGGCSGEDVVFLEVSFFLLGCLVFLLAAGHPWTLGHGSSPDLAC